MNSDECKDCLTLIQERDAAQEWADRLAQGIARVFGEDVGEHSNKNCPWDNAMGILESACVTHRKTETA